MPLFFRILTAFLLACGLGACSQPAPLRGEVYMVKPMCTCVGDYCFDCCTIGNTCPCNACGKTYGAGLGTQ